MPSAWPRGARSPEPAMVTTDQARAIALALPEAVEQDHHGRPSFRVAGRIFATLWTPRALKSTMVASCWPNGIPKGRCAPKTTFCRT